ncbi:MAG: phospho-sugar mutase [Clostridiales bacterium]|nr:phospho-sugar mutase [Clostridiales bacterium]
MKDFLTEYLHWINSPYFDRETKEELKNISDEKEIEERFSKHLNFGTGGLRALVGAGTNRMNAYTVGRATQGLCNYLNKNYKGASVVIAYDSRKHSLLFAKTAAKVLCANGIRVYLFNKITPTPLLSFAVKNLFATAGIVITASHNPKNYNGYKIYLSDGGQIVPPYDRLIADEINNVQSFEDVKGIEEDFAKTPNLLSYIGEEIENKYINAVKANLFNSQKIKEEIKNLKVAYTPLHGTGLNIVKKILYELGVENFFVVKEQVVTDGQFSTVKYPNPEDSASFEMCLNLAKLKNAEVAFATDPDADRVGVCVKENLGEYKILSGNEIGILIADYLLFNLEEIKALKGGVIVTTVVSTKMIYALAREYGVSVKEVLTGFKYIGEQINLFDMRKEQNNLNCKSPQHFIFGFEESFGYLIGSFVRDKDALSAIAILCEMVAYYKAKGLTLYQKLQSLYKKHGFYKEGLNTITLKGVDGAKKIASVMANLRNNIPKFIGEFKVLAIRDYNCLLRYDLINQKTEGLQFNKSEVLYFELDGEAWCCVRPSGTEPKIKIYFGVKGETDAEAERLLKNLEYYFCKIINNDNSFIL